MNQTHALTARDQETNQETNQEAIPVQPKVTLLHSWHDHIRFSNHLDRFIWGVFALTDDAPFEIDAVTEHVAENDGDEYEFTVAISQRFAVSVDGDEQALRDALADALEETAALIRRWGR